MNHTWLRAGRLAVLAVAMACAPLAAQQTTPPSPDRPAGTVRPPDVASPQAIVTALYDVISGPAAQPRDWDRFRSLFLPHARLALVMTGPSGQQRLIDVTVEDFIRLAGPGYQTGAGFWEREAGHHLDQFGNIAQVFSTYETRRTGPGDAVSERGINSIQLLRHENRWWITSLVFDTENAANPIPPQYLNAPME
jgi:hypothetical protein